MTYVNQRLTYSCIVKSRNGASFWCRTMHLLVVYFCTVQGSIPSWYICVCRLGHTSADTHSHVKEKRRYYVIKGNIWWPGWGPDHRAQCLAREALPVTTWTSMGNMCWIFIGDMKHQSHGNALHCGVNKAKLAKDKVSGNAKCTEFWNLWGVNTFVAHILNTMPWSHCPFRGPGDKPKHGGILTHKGWTKNLNKKMPSV